MDGTAAFTSDKTYLQEFMQKAGDGRIQLPEFQRGWIWDDEHIRGLLASVSLSYPIGAVMLLQTGNDQVRFKPRPVEGVELAEPQQPESYILDGQQRLTSLYQALCLDRVVETCDSRGKRIRRWYYIRMADALDSDVERLEAILSLPEDKMVRTFRNEVVEDYSTPEAEFANCVFPLNTVFAPADWRRGYNAYWSHDGDKSKLFDLFEAEVIARFQKYLIPYIELLKESPKVAVCQVFEKVNTGGVPLSVFELVTASFAAEEFDLRADWEGQRNAKGQRTTQGRTAILSEHPVLRSVKATDFLQAVTLLTTYERRAEDGKSPISCKRADILKLDLGSYLRWADAAIEGFVAAARFLFQQKIFSDRDLPYNTQVVPLAAVFALLGSKADNVAVRDKIAKWYWCGVFGELYGSAIESRFARDVAELLGWIDDGDLPSTVAESNFVSSRLHTLRTRGSAAYKGVHALLMRDGGRDFLSGEPIEVQSYFVDKIDIHHIFPSDYCKREGIPTELCNSIVNKTPLSARTNRIIGRNAPSVYLGRLETQKGIEPAQLDDILRSHLIEPEPVRGNQFVDFFGARKEAILRRIEEATGREIPRETPEQEEAEAAEFMIEDDDETQEDVA